MRVDPARNPLRRARLGARLELSDLAERTRISPGMLRHMDEGDFHRLPPGIYARAWVRTVAEVLSLDPAEVLRDLEPALPKAEPIEPEPPPAPAAGAAPVEPRRAFAWASAVPAVPPDQWRRAACAALDGAILTGITIGVWVVAAIAAGTEPSALGVPAAAGIATTALVLAIVYFAVFAGIGGRTPGAALLGVPPEDAPGPLDLGGVGRRALATALAEASIVVELLMCARADELLLRSVLRRT